MAKVKRICAVEGCGKKYHANGLCSVHAAQERNRRLGAATRVSRGWPSLTGRAFLRGLLGTERQDCIVWPYNRNKKSGYGRMRLDGKQMSAHKVMCFYAYGEPPSLKHQAAHSCGNGHLGCVNPNHLRWATTTENFLDKVAHGNCSVVKLNENLVRKIREEIGVKTRSQLCKEFGISYGALYAVLSRRSWKWVS
jgi:hypothetical protein